MTVDVIDRSALSRLLSCLFRRRALQGQELGLHFLALPEGACDVLVPSSLASTKPLAPWQLLEDPKTLKDLPAPPGFEKKGKGKGKSTKGKGKSNGIASFSNQKGRPKKGKEVRSMAGRFSPQAARDSVPEFGRFELEELQLSTAGCTAHIEAQGCCLVSKVFPSHVCRQLADVVDSLLSDVQQKLESADEAALKEMKAKDLGSVHAEEKRWDLKLPLLPEVRSAVELLVTSMGTLLEDLVSRDAILAELACIVSDPGARQQPLHADTLRIGSACAPSLTIFLPLQDMSASMGPTVLCQGSHNLESHISLFKCEQVFMPQDVVIKKHGGLPAVCEEGTAIVMNSNLLHCGGANLPEPMGGRRRRLFYVTFQTPHNTPDRSSFSLREELLEEFHLSDFKGSPHEHPVDPERKALLLKALRGDAQAMADFGELLRAQGDPGAVEYFRKAALQKNLRGFTLLAEVFERGELGIPKDATEAAKLRSFAAAAKERSEE